MAEITEKKFLDLPGLQIYDTKIKQVISAGDTQVLNDAADMFDVAGTAQTKMNELANGQVKTNSDAIAAINNETTGILKQAKDYADTKDASIAEAKKSGDDAQADVDILKTKVGDLDILETTNKTDLVVAINEVRNAVSAGGTQAAVTMDTTTTTEGYSKSYTLKQGDNVIGTIDIPKDMVVSSGEVVTDPEGQDAGTYLVLTLANATSDKVYINVGHLVDIYKVTASATQVQLAINSSTREISATIVAGSITATELADNAVTTVKIADANVTLAKLSLDIQISLGKADSAVQSVTTGTANGTVAVDGTDVAVNGLDSAAYAKITDFDAAGAASAVLGTDADLATANTVYGAKAAAVAAQSAAEAAQASVDAITAIPTAEIEALFATETV